MFHKIRLPEFPAPLLFSLLFSLSCRLCRVKKISASDDDGKQDWFSVPVPPSSGPRLQVTGLSPSTDYQFSILSQNKMGTGPFSDIATARTLGQYHPLVLSKSVYGAAISKDDLILAQNGDLLSDSLQSSKANKSIIRCLYFSSLSAAAN